jgi:hypothetical protein
MITPGEHVEFHGGIAYHVETRVLRQVPIADMINRLAVPPVWTTPILPWGTRLFHQNPTNRTVMIVVEDPFGIKTFATTGLQQPLRLMMPNTVFVFSATKDAYAENEWHLGEVHAFWSKDRLADWTSPVIDVRLPNVYDSGRICFGSTAADADLALDKRIDITVNDFYRSDFNRDLGWRKPQDYRSYAQWAMATRTNPMGWREWSDWSQARPLNDRAAYATTATPINLTGDIPEYVSGSSFGRASQWFEALAAVDRYRLVVGIRSALPRVGMEAEDTGLEYEQDDLREFERTAQLGRPSPATAPNTAETPIPADEVNFARVRGRPSTAPAVPVVCACERCHCLNTDEVTPDDILCPQCERGDHPYDPRY